jgi:hypothetical protein
MSDDEMKESETDLKNDEWFKENYLDLIVKHPREWIAVMDQQIIATSSNEIEVENKAKEIAGSKEFSKYFVAPTATFTDTNYSDRSS